MFGAFVLMRRWYGLHNRKWGAKLQIFMTEDEAMCAIKKIRARRIRHGYVEVDSVFTDCGTTGKTERSAETGYRS